VPATAGTKKSARTGRIYDSGVMCPVFRGSERYEALKYLSVVAKSCKSIKLQAKISG